jgi:hypothetical protein
LNPDPIIDRALFTDGIVRPVYRDDAGHQYVIDADGPTRCYGAWLRPEDAAADAALVVGEPRDPRGNVLRLILSLAVFVPCFAVLGMFAAVDSFFPAWGGALIGGGVGVFFGLAFGGMLPRSVADFFFGPEQQETIDTLP